MGLINHNINELKFIFAFDKARPSGNPYFDRFTLAGILRYFAVATHVNAASYSMFRIPGWQVPKVSTIPNHKHFKIKAHQFLRLPLNIAIENISTELEVYLNETNGARLNFFEREQAQALIKKSSDKNLLALLVINPKDREVPLFK